MLKHLFDIPEEFEYTYSEPTTPENYIAQYDIHEWELYKERMPELWGHIKYILRQQVFDKLGDTLLSGDPICITGKYVTWDKFDTFDKVIQLRVQLQKVQTMNIVMPKWEPVEIYQGHKVEVKELCAACGNIWHDNGKGACSACGSPANWTFK